MPRESQVASDGHAVFRWPQLIVFLVGALLMLLGIIGWFFATPVTPSFWTRVPDHTMVGLSLNGLLVTVYLAVGLIGVGCSSSMRTSRLYGMVIGALGALLFVFGIVAVTFPRVNVLSLNWPDNALHLIIAALGLTAALVNARARHPYGGTQEAGNQVEGKVVGNNYRR